jgi:hypothetical protein
MTHDERVIHGDDVPPGLLEIDAMLDGEPVDEQALRSALDDDAARDYLVEALRLRRLARDIGPARFAIPGSAPREAFRGARWLAAGVIFAIGSGIGYVYGQDSGTHGVSSALVEVALDNPSVPPAPAPTRSIRFEPGVNWTIGPRSH